MSHHECLLISSVLLLMINTLWKWSNLLMVLVLFEMISSLLLFLIVSFCLEYVVIIFMFLFFVSEALILIASFYSCIRLVGSVFSSLVIF